LMGAQQSAVLSALCIVFVIIAVNVVGGGGTCC